MAQDDKPADPSSRARKLLDFIELAGFEDDWRGMGLDDDDLLALQLQILRDPEAAPVLRGTGGLRKLRFSPPKWPRGKSGAVRVCYAQFVELGIVALVIAYPKSDQDDLSDDDVQKIKTILGSLRDRLTRRRHRR